MANPNIGEIACPFENGCVGKVRQYSRGSAKLYYACKHGMITPNLDAGQRWMEANMIPVEQSDIEPEKIDIPEKKPKPKRSRLAAFLLEDDDE